MGRGLSRFICRENITTRSRPGGEGEPLLFALVWGQLWSEGGVDQGKFLHLESASSFLLSSNSLCTRLCSEPLICELLPSMGSMPDTAFYGSVTLLSSFQ